MSSKHIQPFYAPGVLLMLFGVVLTALKLLGTINDWSWWVVTMPFWIGPAVALFLFMLFLLLAAFAGPRR